MQKSDNPVIQEIFDKLALLEFNKQIEPLKATLHGGNKLFIERINGSSKYLSHLRKVIYDVKFENCYYHDGKVPEGCFAIGNEILRIEEQTGVGIQFPEDSNPELFLEILNRPNPKPVGMRFFLDGTLYMQNVPFLRSNTIRDEILIARHKGTMIFDVLKVIDPSGNVTEFHASSAVQKRMGKVRETAHNQMIVNRVMMIAPEEVVYDKL